ncbi:MAG: hypothetical protein AAF434_13690 [Pseudomonadota bacterium]
MSDCTIACSLSSSELFERKQTVLKKLNTYAVGQKKLSNGFAFRFNPSTDILQFLIEFIDLERQCCSFLTFHLSVEPENGPFWLELTGPEGTHEMLSLELGLGELEPISNNQ